MNIVLQGYLARVGKLSAVKLKILTRLWTDDEAPFPKPWVPSSELLAITAQKYFDRRTRELRDQLGCDIENAPQSGEHCYRLVSTNLQTVKPRGYLTGGSKKSLFERFSYTCQICGSNAKAGVRGLQADHKIPLDRGGSNSEDNWQPLCNECNVGKRGACAGCLDECRKCPWAFPETVGRLTLVRLPPAVLDALGRRSGRDQKRLEQEIVRILKSDLQVR
jgi:5-methylcytosine-specific restriction endonuclease McrA